MNTQEQAYINGFVKRAAEYGYSENDATQLAKEAMRGAGAVNLAAGLKSPILAESAVPRGFNIPGRGTPRARYLAELLREMKAQEKIFPTEASSHNRDVLRPHGLGRPNLGYLDNQNEALRMMR